MAARLIRRGAIYYTWVPLITGGTRRVSTGCTDRKAAEKRAGELERQAVDPSHRAALQATTEDAANGFIASRALRGRAEGTLDFYGKKLSHAVRLLPRLLHEVDHAVLEAYCTTRVGEGSSHQNTKKELTSIGSMLRHAKRQGLFEGDLERVMPEYADEYQPRETALTPDQAVMLVKYLESERAAHVAIMVGGGMRWAESNRASAADFTPELVQVHGSKTITSTRKVPIAAGNLPFLFMAFVWLKEHGSFYAWPNVRRDLAVACKALDIPAVTPNDLRRTYGQWLRNAGVATDLIGSAMGHADSRMVERVYGRIAADKLRNLIAQQSGGGLMDIQGDKKDSDRLLMTGPTIDENAKTPQKQADSEVPRDRIELPTRGFSIRGESRCCPQNTDDSPECGGLMDRVSAPQSRLLSLLSFAWFARRSMRAAAERQIATVLS